jgi:hypothetical protein
MLMPVLLQSYTVLCHVSVTVHVVGVMVGHTNSGTTMRYGWQEPGSGHTEVVGDADRKSYAGKTVGTTTVVASWELATKRFVPEHSP